MTFEIRTLRFAICALAVCAGLTLTGGDRAHADTPAAQPDVDQFMAKGPLVSDKFTVRDYCTVLLSPDLRKYLGLNADQQEQLDHQRDYLKAKLNALCADPISDPQPLDMLSEETRYNLHYYGQEVRDVLTTPQDNKLQKLFDDGILKPAEIKVAAAQQAGHYTIDVHYSPFTEAMAAPKPAYHAATKPSDSLATPYLAHKFTASCQPFDGVGGLGTYSVPHGTRATSIVGGNGGGPFVLVKPGIGPVRGFFFNFAQWNGRQIIHEIEPLYGPSDSSTPLGNNVVYAKDGYIVGAVTIDATDCVNAIKVAFIRYPTPKGDSSDLYWSDWCGETSGDLQQQLAGNGELIVGVCGRKGLNIDALGLIFSDPDSKP
jgi:hypothetical protein